MGTALQNSARLVILHGYHQSLLWATPGTAMLVPYAQTSVYHNAVRVHGRFSGDRVQMGRRHRGDALQRSTPRECSESRGESASDFFYSEDLARNAAVTAATEATGGEGLSQLRPVRAGERSGLFEHRYGFGRCIGAAGRAAGRFGARHHGRLSGSGSAAQRWSIHDHTGRSGRSHDVDGGEGSHGRDCMYVAVRDIPRSPALGAVADESAQSAQKTLKLRRSAPWRNQVRRGS